MRGVHQAKASVLAHLQANIAGYVSAVEADEGLIAGSLVSPQTWILGPERPPEMMASGSTKYPVIFIDEGAEVASVDFLDRQAADPIFEVTYNLRVTVWVKHDKAFDYDEVTLLRDRLDLAVKSCLMDRPTIVPRVLRLELESFRTEYSDPWEDSVGKPCSAARVSFNARQVETLIHPLLVDASALTETVEVQRLP